MRLFFPCRGGGEGEEETRSHLEKGSYAEASQAGNSLCVRENPPLTPRQEHGKAVSGTGRRKAETRVVRGRSPLRPRACVFTFGVEDQNGFGLWFGWNTRRGEN